MQAHDGRSTILVGEDDLEVRAYLEMALRCMGYSVELADDGDAVLSYLDSSASTVSAVLLDIIMPQRDGIETLKEIRQMAPDLPVIIISGASSTLNVVNAMRSGATDFLCKPVVHEELQRAIYQAVDRRPSEQRQMPQPNSGAKTRAFLGNSPGMKNIQQLVTNVGWSQAPVLIQGETGSGKEVLARELHAKSPRADKIFLKLNCAALPSELVESELFGYERGAFTGAFQKKVGMFELADGGTLLLDEIGDMDVRLQAKLLQVLQDHEFQRIGGKQTIKVDVRIMAATHRELETAIRERSFREDLFYRLNVINIQMPPLRERREDIISLAEYLLSKHSVAGMPTPVITPDLRSAMLSYHWPGNVRELENTVRQLIILRDPHRLAKDLEVRGTRNGRQSAETSFQVPSDVRSIPANAEEPVLERVTKAKRKAEAEAILSTLNSTRWNRKQAAALLKIDYKALLYKMKKLGIEDGVDPYTLATSEDQVNTAGAGYVR
jgi:two-component system, NtrC family, response regulator AtoC